MPNRLAEETSPYLLQHADNPVDWYPWGEEALAAARAADRPILLSIGYSACHWCHVMAHESFADPETARLMNALFVNIKVDREERPDLDRIYQTAHQLLAHRPGGWPLTVFLTPDDLTPFFAGTYFPPAPRHGLPAFRQVLQQVADFYRAHRAELARQNAAVREALARAVAGPAPAGRPDEALLAAARRALAEAFDARHGGFGAAPKFPHPGDIDLLLRLWCASRRRGAPDRQALHMAVFTLEQMARGGLCDQLGGGFFRYSTDARWDIPHFEKMLYDNGLLLGLYAQAHAATGRGLFARVARATAEWAMTEMQTPDGGYYASLDADSAGGEGDYYLWTPDQARALLTPEEYALLARHYGLDGPPNFEGRWHLRVRVPLDELARADGPGLPALGRTLDQARRRLLAARAERPRPARDEKVLTAWNALMIRGMALAARHLDEPRYAESATRAVDFIRARLWRNGRLLAVWKDGRARFPAYLDDHAFLLHALLELLQLRWRDADLAFARDLAELLLARFQDTAAGGFFFTADDHETLPQRPKPWADESLPAGNAVAALALARLGHLLGEPRYLTAAERTVQAAAGALAEHPLAHGSLLAALAEQLEPPRLLVLRGTDAAAVDAWQRAALRPYAPDQLSFAPPVEAALPPALASKAPQGPVCAYPCQGSTCAPPVTERAGFDALLAGAACAAEA